MMSHSPLKNIPGRLRWQCRRSCLEIDLLLNAFLDHPQGYVCLVEAEQQAFQILLAQDDTDLLEWLLGRKACDDVRVQRVLEKITGLR